MWMTFWVLVHSPCDMCMCVPFHDPSRSRVQFVVLVVSCQVPYQ
jgi:hypothetical protein